MTGGFCQGSGPCRPVSSRRATLERGDGLVATVAGNEDDGEVGKLGDLPHQLDTVGVGQHQVEQHQPRPLGPDDARPFLRRAGHERGEAGVALMSVLTLRPSDIENTTSSARTVSPVPSVCSSGISETPGRAQCGDARAQRLDLLARVAGLRHGSSFRRVGANHVVEGRNGVFQTLGVHGGASIAVLRKKHDLAIHKHVYMTRYLVTCSLGRWRTVPVACRWGRVRAGRERCPGTGRGGCVSTEARSRAGVRTPAGWQGGPCAVETDFGLRRNATCCSPGISVHIFWGTTP